jgi:Immunity protein 50
MELPNQLKAVEGAEKLYAWFGYWPTFHDAEVVEMHLSRSSSSSLVIHTWEMTSEVDLRGYYVLAKHVVVEFLLNGISGLDLSGFNHQNVLSELAVEKIASGFRLTLGACYGIAGAIETNEISIRLVPGKPQDARP